MILILEFLINIIIIFLARHFFLFQVLTHLLEIDFGFCLRQIICFIKICTTSQFSFSFCILSFGLLVITEGFSIFIIYNIWSRIIYWRHHILLKHLIFFGFKLNYGFFFANWVSTSFVFVFFILMTIKRLFLWSLTKWHYWVFPVTFVRLEFIHVILIFYRHNILTL